MNMSTKISFDTSVLPDEHAREKFKRCFMTGEKNSTDEALLEGEEKKRRRKKNLEKTRKKNLEKTSTALNFPART